MRIKDPRPLEPSYPGRRRRRRDNLIYVVEERPTYVVQKNRWYYPSYWRYSNWWYPRRWYSHWFYEGFQNERNMNCSMLIVLLLILLVVYFSK